MTITQITVTKIKLYWIVSLGLAKFLNNKIFKEDMFLSV